MSEDNLDLNELLPIGHVAILMQISHSAVLALVTRGRLRARKIGFALFSVRRDVYELMNSPDYIKRTRRMTTLKELEANGQLTLARDLLEQQKATAVDPESGEVL